MIEDRLSQSQISTISKFQKKWQQRRVLMCFDRFNKVFYDTRKIALSKPKIDRKDSGFIAAHGINYDLLTNHIQKDVVIKITNAILNRLYLFMNTSINISKGNDYINYMIASRITGKELLSAFCFAGFPEFTLLKSPSELKNDKDSIFNDIYTLSKELIGAWGVILIKKDKDKKEALRIFIKSLNMYSNCYNIFMNQDKLTKVNEGIQRWYQGEKTIKLINESKKYTESEKEAIIKNFNLNQENLIKMIKSIAQNFKEDNLNKYKQLMEKIEDNMEIGFWDILKDEIKNDKYDFFLKLLQEIHDEMLSLLPTNENSKIRKFISDDIQQYFDINFIKQMILNNSFTGENFLKLSEHLLDLLKELQAPSRTPEMINEWNILLEDIHNDNIKIEDKSVKIIKFLLNEIRMVKDNILSLSIMADFGIDVFNIK